MPPRIPSLALCSSSRHLLRRHTRQIRYSSSSSSSSQSPKICTVPFRQPPNRALEKMHINGLVASASFKNLILAGLIRLFGSGIISFAKEFGFGEDLVMRDMKACYWPVWRCDGIFEGISESSKSRKEIKGWLGVEEGYIPGNSFAPLSYLSYSVPPLPENELQQYDPETHLNQLGEGYEIVPVPFTVSPFEVIKRIRKMVGKRSDWKGMKIDEAKWKETMFACYPLMFPIYIADFELKSEDGTRRFNVIMDAHDEDIGKCRASWPPPPQMIEQGRFKRNFFVNPAPFLPQITLIMPKIGPLNEDTDNRPITASDLNETYSTWMSPPPTGPNTIPPSPTYEIEQSTSKIDWEDIRIQSWIGTERDENVEYFSKAEETIKGIAALQGIAELTASLPAGSDPKGMVMTVGRGDGKPSMEPKPISEIKADLSKDLDRMKDELEELKPKWLREWQVENIAEQLGKKKPGKK